MWSDAVSSIHCESATTMAKEMNVNSELPEERQRKLPRRLDENPPNAATVSPIDGTHDNKFLFWCHRRADMVLDNWFPPELTDFAFLETNNFELVTLKYEFKNLPFATTCSQLVSTIRQVGT